MIAAVVVPSLAGGPADAIAPGAPSSIAAVGSGGSAPSTASSRTIRHDDVAKVFTPLDSFRFSATRRVNVVPKAYAASRIVLSQARAALSLAPDQAAVDGGARPVEIALRAPDGTTAAFSVVETSVMEPALAARHPELKTYAGNGITNPFETIRLDVTPLGLHASVRRLNDDLIWYVDPAYLGRGTSAHISYLVDDLPKHDQGFDERFDPPANYVAPPVRAPRAGETVIQRTYRMAFVTTPSYATFFGTGNVLATKVTQINRTNHLYSDDMAISFVLVDGTEKLNLDTQAKATGANGPCGANACFATAEISSCGGNAIDRNNFVAGQIIGADKFDIGHLGSGAGSGGVAYLGVIGGKLKAGGCTALNTPTGDFYTIDFFAHEVGHQVGGNHTFDGNSGSCAAPNRNADTSVEPGSGSSVMAYAGICLSDDLQPHSDPYFSQRTIDEFSAVTTAAPTTLAEQQIVNLTGLDAGDSFQLTYGAATPQTITMGTNYTVAGLDAALLLLTGKAVQVTSYDGASALGPQGFTADWPDQLNALRLGLGTTTGGVAGFVGVTLNGGAITNQGAAVATSNHRPVVTAPVDKTLPVQTPFSLTGSATDADAGQSAGLTYLWEQNDPGLPGDPILGTGPGTLLSSPSKLAGPLFRVFGLYAAVTAADTLLYESPGQNLADGNPTRTFPDIAQILAGNTNAEAPCPPPTTDPMSAMEGASLDCLSEFLPDAAYAALSGALNFRLTVRDGFVGGGGTGFDDVTLSVDPTVGPFLVTSRGTSGTTATAGATEPVVWDTAGTNSATFAQNVKISVSLDGGLTYPFVAAASTPNDGAEDIVLPSLDAAKARIKVEAVGNYFFDINNADFAITGGVEPPVAEAPQTRITGGVAANGFLVGSQATYTFSSDQADSTFRCTIDEKATACGNGSVTLEALEPGNHTFTVAASNPGGLADPSAATRHLAVVFDDRVLRQETAGWQERTNRGAYLKTYLTTKQKKQVLSLEVTRMSRLALLVNQAPGFGRLAVYVGGTKVGTVDLEARTAAAKVLVQLKRFTEPRTGTVTIKTLDGKTVQIDGIGVFQQPRR